VGAYQAGILIGAEQPFAYDGVASASTALADTAASVYVAKNGTNSRYNNRVLKLAAGSTTPTTLPSPISTVLPVRPSTPPLP
jgi:hypothetical protein